MPQNQNEENSALATWIKQNIAPLITLAAFISSVFAGYFWLDSRYAKATELAQLEQRFEIKITSDAIQETNARIWQLQDRLQQRPDDLTAKEELRTLQENKNRLEHTLEALQKIP